MWIDALSLAGALDEIEKLVDSGQGGAVCPLPERAAGSALLNDGAGGAAPVAVSLLGGAPGVAPAAARLLSEKRAVNVVGGDDWRIGIDESDDTGDSIARARAAKPDLVLVALGPPKQELWIPFGSRSDPSFGIGAGLDSMMGRHQKAPRWIARAEFELGLSAAAEAAATVSSVPGGKPAICADRSLDLAIAALGPPARALPVSQDRLTVVK